MARLSTWPPSRDEVPLSNLVPEIDANFRLESFVSPDQMPSVLKIYDEIMIRLEQKEPDFFPRFERALRSHKHLRIQLAMVHAAEMTREVLLEMPEFRGLEEVLEANRDELSSTAAELGPNGTQDLAKVDEFLAKISSELQAEGEPKVDFYLALAVAVALVLVYPPAVALALALAVIWVVWYPLPTGDPWIGDQLLKEQVINSLATNIP